ncbi:MAG: tetratricopeptide repeat protein [Dongiaceae bacterium]
MASAAAASPSEPPAYVGSQSCGTCHAAEAQAWSHSHHSWALREATPQNVLGDFEDAQFEHNGVTSRFFREDDRFFVETDGPDGRLARFEIKYVVGVSPLQQYLVELDGGRLQALDIAWDAEAKRWYHLYPNEEVSAGNGLHWTGAYKNWQARCAVCHQSDFHKNYAPKTHGYQSTWSELTIGCEACHGPGQAHVAWAEDKSNFDPSAFTGIGPNGLDWPKASSKQASERNMCGPCHARREAIGADSTPATAEFGDHYSLSTLDGRLYFPDGQQDAEVYILGSFLQSKMHQKGVTCTNCHEPHSGELEAEGNAVCTQCHNPVGRSEFPTLVRKDFDSPAHHHHSQGSAGAQCVNCHMPERKYMLIDGRRDHFFRVPDPLLSQKIGSPDVCLACHAGKTAEWAAMEIHRWAPDWVSKYSRYATLFADVRQDGLDPTRISALAALALDDRESAMVRATALREIGAQSDAGTARSLASLLSDDSDLVRRMAVRLWRNTSPDERIKQLQPMLSDPVASVRIAAALELSSVPPDALDADRRPALEAASNELRASMEAKADFPEGQLAIGGLAMTTRNWPAARAAFAEAVRMDPQLVEAWSTQARIAEAQGDRATATDILVAAHSKNPENSAIAMQLAGLLLQQDRVTEAIPVLRPAAAADPTNQEARINLALALLQTGDIAGAGPVIAELRALAPNRFETLVLLGLQQVASNDLSGARATVRELMQRYPGVRLPPQLEALSRLP